MNNQEIGIISPITPTESGVVIYAVNDRLKDYFETLIKECGYRAVEVSEPQIKSADVEPYDKQDILPDEERKVALWADEIARELKNHSDPILLIQSEIISEQYSRGYGVFLAELVWCDVICPTIIASFNSEPKDHRYARRIRRAENSLLNPIISLESDWLNKTPLATTPHFIFFDVINDKSKLENAIKASQATAPSNFEAEALLNISKELIEAEMEEFSHSIRHQFQNVIASLRLLLGAFTAGDITYSDLQETVEKLECRQQDSVFSRLEDLQKKWVLKETELSSLSSVRSVEGPSQSEEPAKGNVIIIDDEYFPQKIENSDQPKQFKNFGWEPVHRQLLSNSNRFKFDITAFNSYESAINGIDLRLLSETEFIILDINLGDPAKSGLLLLHQIRLLHPFVPIIVMTSYDDARICQFILEWQADAFFAKQLQDGGDRNSKKYYAKFVETIESVLADNINVRRLYNKFINNLNTLGRIDDYIEKTVFEIPDGSDTVKSRLDDGVISQLTHFFLLLRIMDQRHREDEVKISNLDENLNLLITLLLGVINAWLHFPRPTNSELVKISQWFDEHPESEELAKELNVKLVDRKNFIESIKSGRHERFRHTNNSGLNIEKICEIAEEFLNLVEAYTFDSSGAANISNRRLKDAEPINSFPKDMAAQLVKRAAEKEKKQSLNHSINSKMGAGAVLAGAYLEQTAETTDENSAELFDFFKVNDKAADFITIAEEACENQNEKPIFIRLKEKFPIQPVILTLIDDHGTENGWAYVTQLIHNNLLVNNVTLEGTSNTADSYSSYIQKNLDPYLFESDVFFVDLKMPKRIDLEPSVDSGLEVIKLIKTRNPTAKIIVLSATSDSVNLRKAIAHGAREFFVKEIPGSSAAELSEYAKQFSDLTSIFETTSDEFALIKEFRFVLPSLTKLVKDIESGGRNNFLRKRNNIGFVFKSDIRSWLGLNAKSTDAEINFIIINYLELLLRRIFFLHSLSEERYSSNWLGYFAASSRINPAYLVHSQIWLSCGMLVEWVFNFVAFGLNVQRRSVTPGERELNANIAIQNFLGRAAFELGFTGYSGIWDRRGKRGDLKYKSLEQARKESFEIVRDTLKFVNSINLDLTPIKKTTFSIGTISTLRKNLEQSKKNAVRRPELHNKLLDLEKKRKQYDSVNYRFRERDLINRDIIVMEISALESELKALSNDSILENRHSLLAHLLKL